MAEDQAEAGYVVDFPEVAFARTNMLVKKLRDAAWLPDTDERLILDAADEIERLVGVIKTYSRQYER